MQRGIIIMLIGIAVEIINHFFSAQWVKGISGYITIIGWVIFFAGIGIRQLDKRKSSLNDSRRKKKSL